MDPTQSLVLVIDDEPSVRRVLKEMLTAAGFGVITAGDTDTALRLLGAHHVGLIITDLMMPQVGGVAFIQQVRAVEGFRQIPIVVLTGFASGLGATAKAAGAQRVMRKPDDLTGLVATARELIDKK